MENYKNENSRVATNLRTLLILEALSDSSVALSPTEINRSIGLPKQSIHRLCQTLVEEGFLIRDTSGNRLRPAPRAIKMAHGLFNSRQHTIARHQILVNLSAATGETVNFVVAEPDGMTYLDRVETDWIFRIELPIGSRVPFYCTASGKCFLASLDSKSLGRLISAINFEHRTPNTITDARSLRVEIEQVRKQGYSIDNEELFRDMVALSVPVVDKNGRFLAAVAFHGPTQRLNHDTLTQHLDTMHEGAAQLASLTE